VFAFGTTYKHYDGFLNVFIIFMRENNLSESAEKFLRVQEAHGS
jgi:hypothetical protein